MFKNNDKGCTHRLPAKEKWTVLLLLLRVSVCSVTNSTLFGANEFQRVINARSTSICIISVLLEDVCSNKKKTWWPTPTLQPQTAQDGCVNIWSDKRGKWEGKALQREGNEPERMLQRWKGQRWIKRWADRVSTSPLVFLHTANEGPGCVRLPRTQFSSIKWNSLPLNMIQLLQYWFF